MWCRSPNRCDGFTLLEVLVALAVLVLAYGVILQMQGEAARRASQTDDYRRALMVAESRLSLALGVRDPRTLSLSGADDAGYRWELRLEASPDFEVADVRSIYAPLLATVTVEWPGTGGRMRSVELSSVRLAAGVGR